VHVLFQGEMPFTAGDSFFCGAPAFFFFFFFFTKVDLE
jgi:hypothetical protein